MMKSKSKSRGRKLPGWMDGEVRGGEVDGWRGMLAADAEKLDQLWESAFY